MRTLRISFKSFDRAIQAFFHKRLLQEPVRNIIAGDIDWVSEMIQQLAKNYRQKPFKKQSTYRLANYGPDKKDLKIGYIFENDKLYFKLFIRCRSGRFVRLTQLIISKLHK